MIGRQDRWQEDLFVAGALSSLIPEDHILKQVDKVLDLSRLRDEVKDLYCCDHGRPGIDPEAAVRLMLAGFFQGIVHDRKLMREAKTQHGLRRAVRRGLSNIAIQAYLTAVVINLKRLVAFLGLFFAQYCFNVRHLWRQRRYDVSTSRVSANFGGNFPWRKTE